MIDRDAITWLPATPRTDLRCPVCASTGTHHDVLDVASLSPPHEPLRLVRCGACASLFYERQDIADFSDFGETGADFWRFYVEEGAGIWETVWPPLLVGAKAEQSLLDVGCGFGFSLDFWTRTGKGAACGVELADYGRLGRDLLGVPIYQQYLQDCAELAGRTFDIVYASEVVEHVPDPRAFVRLLSRWLAPEGTLVLTTPTAAYIRPEHASSTLLAALAPGFHAFLLSPPALERIVREAGFGDVRVREFTERQVLWASRTALRLHEDPEAVRGEYVRYIAERAADASDTSAPLWQGFAYRAVRDLLNAGEIRAAKAVADRLCAALAQRYGPGVLEPDEMVPKLASATTLADVGAVAPFFLPCLYFLLGAIAEHAAGDTVGARRWYRGSHAATVACVDHLGSSYFLEAISLVWPARAAEARVRLRDRDWQGAGPMLVALGQAHALVPENRLDLPAPELVEDALPRAIDTLVDAGQRDLARAVADAYRSYVVRRYGEDMTSAAGIERALAAHARIPADPLLPPWFDAVEQSWRASAPAQDNAAAREVVRIAKRFDRNVRIAERRARAERLLAPPATISYSFSFTLTPPKR